jgi:hypothetical protein
VSDARNAFMRDATKMVNDLQKGVRTLVAQYTVKACNMAVKNAPKASGSLAASLNYKFERDGLTGIVYAAAKYAPFPEGFFYGSQPGCKARGPGGWPPKEEILRWLEFKHLPVEMLYPVRRKIALKGTTATPFMMPALEANRQPFLDDGNALMAKAAKIMEGKMTIEVGK